MEDLKYPIGKFVEPGPFDMEKCEFFIRKLETFSPLFAQTALELNSDQLHKSYRPGGWNAIQLIHHVADSHMNSYIRFKLALTERDPVIKPYDENRWSDLTDAREGGVSSSLQIISGLHYRWVMLLRSLQQRDFDRCVFHPEYQQKQTLYYLLAYYAWHAEHHLGHLKLIRNS